MSKQKEEVVSKSDEQPEIQANKEPQKEVASKEDVTKMRAELEQLRAFKAEADAAKKAQVAAVKQEKKETVNTSGMFFSREDEVYHQKPSSNIEKHFEELYKRGEPRRHE